MRLSELAEYVQKKYGLGVDFITSGEVSMAALIVPGAETAFALLIKQGEKEGLDLHCGSIAAFLAKQPGFGAPICIKDRGWLGVDLTAPELNDRFLLKTLDTAYQAGRPAVKRREHMFYVADRNDESPYEDEAIPERGSFVKRSDHRRVSHHGSDVIFSSKSPVRGRDDTPPAISRMLESYDYQLPVVTRREANFYYQGMMMADYEDNFSYSGQIRFRRPVYHDLSVKELRDYFSWRSRVRQGDFAPAKSGFLYLLTSEIVCQIGIKDPLAGLRQLRLLQEHYQGQDQLTIWDLKHLIQVYLVYYGIKLSPEEGEQEFAEEIKRAEPYETLLANAEGDSKVYQALLTLAKSKPGANPLLKEDPEKYASLVADVWKEIKASPKQLAQQLVGEKSVFPMHLFADAAFYSPHPIEAATYQVGQAVTYRCKDGKWTSEVYWPAVRQHKLLPDLLHEIDRRSRLALGRGRKMKERPLPAALQEAIEAGIKTYLREAAEREKPKIHLNLSSLAKIRGDAAETRESLLTEEERQLESQEAEAEQEAAESQQAAPSQECKESFGQFDLTPEEGYVLQQLMAGKSVSGYVKQHHLLTEVLADSINEKLFDEIGDSVIEIAGAEPELVEDYRDDLSDLFGSEE